MPPSSPLRRVPSLKQSVLRAEQPAKQFAPSETVQPGSVTLPSVAQPLNACSPMFSVIPSNTTSRRDAQSAKHDAGIPAVSRMVTEVSPDPANISLESFVLSSNLTFASEVQPRKMRAPALRSAERST